MELDWDFYFDDWLIDKVPDGFEIRVESHPNGEIINPPELDVYFGANPKYLYGTGKLLHEVLMSPSGIAVFPSFLGRPGFEFVEEISFSLGFNKSIDFHGKDVEKQHVGLVDATKYLQDVMSKLSGIGDNDYFSVSTQSLKLRSTTEKDFNQALSGAFDQYVYESFPASLPELIVYLPMSTHEGTGRLLVAPDATGYEIHANSATILTPGTYKSVLFSKFAFVEITSNSMHAFNTGLSNNEFAVIFMTSPESRDGVIIEQSYSNIVGDYKGIRVELSGTGIIVTLGKGQSVEVFSFLTEVNLVDAHSWSIEAAGGRISCTLDGTTISSHSTSGGIVVDTSRPFLLCGIDIGGVLTPSGAGDLENVIILTSIPKDLSRGILVDGKQLYPIGSVDPIKDVPPLLSYDLTYTSPTEVFLPNYFGTSFNKFYLNNEIGSVKIIGGKKVNSAYVIGGEPFPDHSVLMPTGYRFNSATTYTFEDGVDDGIIGTKIKALTKVTSDVHIPLRIHMKFRLPEFYDRNTTYNMSLMFKSLDKFLWYEYTKFKTGEFI